MQNRNTNCISVLQAPSSSLVLPLFFPPSFPLLLRKKRDNSTTGQAVVHPRPLYLPPAGFSGAGVRAGCPSHPPAGECRGRFFKTGKCTIRIIIFNHFRCISNKKATLSTHCAGRAKTPRLISSFLTQPTTFQCIETIVNKQTTH